MHRHFSFLVIAVCLSLAATLTMASAQGTATGTLVGHLAWCRFVRLPVGGADAESVPVADVLPHMAHTLTRPVRIPAADVQLSLLGTSVTAITDANGGFTLSGVPAAQPLTLVAAVPAGPPLMLSGPSLVVAADQTRDLGSLGLAGCGDSGAVLSVAPTPAVDGTLPAETDPTADPADPQLPN